jgi:Uma2 family endonuclease
MLMLENNSSDACVVRATSLNWEPVNLIAACRYLGSSTMVTVTTPSVKPFGPRDAGIPLTLSEFEKADYVKGFRYELIHGVLVVVPPALEEERDANEELGHWLRNYRERHPRGHALDLTLPEHNLRTVGQNRRADRVIWAGLGRRPRTRGRPSRRDVPTIIVEFPSSRAADQRRAYQEKKVEYRKIGVREYWIIDRYRRTMTVYYWRGRRWTKQTIGESEVYRTPFLPGFELRVRDLFRISDQYADEDEDDWDTY